jgi:hypothetical protein
VNNSICRRLAEVRLSEHDRQRVRYALRDAETIVAAAIWVKERIASLGAMLPKPGFKH